MKNYFQGTTVRVTAEFENSSHVDTDPTGVTFKFDGPAGTTTTYVYGVNAQVVRSATGIYYVDIDLTAAGVWYYRFEGTGAVKAASQGSLTCIAANPA